MLKELPAFEFGIARILDCGFSIEEAHNPEDGLQIGYGMSFLFDPTNSWIQFNIRVDFTTQKTSALAVTGTVMTRFSVNSLSDFLDENNIVNFPEGAVESLFGIAYSHLRAILAKNLSGSRFNDLYVPVANPNELFHSLFQANVERAKSKLPGNGPIPQFEIINSSKKIDSKKK